MTDIERNKDKDKNHIKNKDTNIDDIHILDKNNNNNNNLMTLDNVHVKNKRNKRKINNIKNKKNTKIKKDTLPRINTNPIDKIKTIKIKIKTTGVSILKIKDRINKDNIENKRMKNTKI